MNRAIIIDVVSEKYIEAFLDGLVNEDKLIEVK